MLKLTCALAVCLGLLLFAGPVRAGQAPDPTPEQIVTEWRALAGNLAGKVVYWKSNEIRVMDLTTGAVTTVAANLPRSTEAAVGPYPVWSPDGKRILYYTHTQGKQFRVMNADGSNMKVVSQGGPWTYGTCSWWDKDWVVVQENAPNYIVRTRLDEQNNVVESVTVVDFPPYGGRGREWVSMSGDYVAWTDWGANEKGLNRSLVRNWKTGAETEACPRTEDVCSIALKTDGSGTSIYCHNDHHHVEMKNFAGQIIGTLSVIDGERVEMLRWSNHPDFLCHQGSRVIKDPEKGRAWIRKLADDKDTGKYIFLGNGVWGPDVWVQMPQPEKPEVKKPAEKPAPAAKAEPKGPSPEEEAARMMKFVKDMMKDKKFVQMNRATIETQLKAIVEKYPDTDTAAEAKKLLQSQW
jgi:hypothetical protein